MLGRTDSRLRLLTLLCAMAVFAGALGLRLAYWQVGEASELRRRAEAQRYQPQADDIRRGDIFDRRGTLLATTAYRDLLAAHPDLIRADQRGPVAQSIARLLDFSPKQEEQLVERFESAVPYLVVSRRLTELQSQHVRAKLASGELAALSLEPQPVRFYPNSGGSPSTTLASQLLGFVTDDGQGQYGVEQRHQQVLAGQAGLTAAADDTLLLPAAGASVQLTIDASLQLRLEKELYAAWVANRAERVSAVVIDPHTGAVLAWGSVPGYDANDYRTTARKTPERFTDPIASQIYEPGSVMKMFTAAAALEQGTVTLDSTVRDALVLRFGETLEVRNADRRSMGRISFEDAIAFSRNVATGRIAQGLGETTAEAAVVLHEMWQRLGIGQLTGIELSGEAGGLVADPAESRWQDVDLVNRAFGQGVGVTPLQLAVSFSAMVNGGKLVQPHLLAAVDGEPREAREAVQVLDPALSDDLRQLMVHVVTAVDHYAEGTLIPGYVVGGKTGTAQIWDARKGVWKDDVYNHSFIGFLGRDEPDVVIAVRIHEAEPRIKRRFVQVLELTSHELFRRIAQETIEVLDLAPLEPPDEPPDDATDETPDEAADPDP
jgi:cell division protein FtsI/penicillin-binding protein 2